jgi:HlyD family secretion protein
MKPPLGVRVALVLVLAAGGTGAWLYRTGRLTPHHAPADELTLYGNVDVRQVELGFRVAGRLKTMGFEEGQPVTAGTLLASLDSRTFEDELHLAEADVAAQDATVKKLVTGNRPAEIAKARAAVEEAVAAQQNARSSFERAQQLIASQAISASTFDEALAATRMADARLASATEAHKLLVEGSRSEDIAVAKATLHAAQARLQAAQTALDDTRLLAPADGVVLSRVREPGAIVSPNDIVYVLALTGSVWVRAYVAEPQLGRLRLGMEVAIFSDSAPRRPVRAHVGFISPTAEFTPKSVETPDLRADLVYRLRIIVDEADAGLLQGMPVTVRIETGGVGP